MVDVDEVCFGDRLLHVGLTRMALLDQRWETDDVTALCAYDGFDRAGQALDFYTAVYCADFLGELGHAFNREQPLTVRESVVERRTQILESLLARLAK